MSLQEVTFIIITFYAYPAWVQSCDNAYNRSPDYLTRHARYFGFINTIGLLTMVVISSLPDKTIMHQAPSILGFLMSGYFVYPLIGLISHAYYDEDIEFTRFNVAILNSVTFSVVIAIILHSLAKSLIK